MNLQEGDEETVVKFNIDLTKDERESIKKLALDHIVEDEAALINYGINYMLRQKIEEYAPYVDDFEETDDVKEELIELEKTLKLDKLL